MHAINYFFNELFLNRYAAEDSLELVLHQDELDHAEIGHYFSTTNSFPTRHYVPNDELQLRYPDDASFTLNAITKYVEQLDDVTASQDE